MTDGAWGSELDILTGAGAITGDAYIHVTSGTSQRGMETGFFEVASTHAYIVSAFVKGVSGTGDLRVSVQWYLSDFSYDSESGLLFDATSTASWTEKRSTVFPPAGVKFAKVKVYKDTPSTAAAWYVDSVRLRDVGLDWTEPTLGSSWVDYNASTHPIAAYRVDPYGRIMLKGAVKDGGTGSGNPMFTLPVGFRPPRVMNFAVVSSTGHGRLEVSAAGLVYLVSGGTGIVSLDQVSFETWE
jgi:hypothetical protein